MNKIVTMMKLAPTMSIGMSLNSFAWIYVAIAVSEVEPTDPYISAVPSMKNAPVMEPRTIYFIIASELTLLVL